MIQVHTDATFTELSDDGEILGYGDARDLEPEVCPTCHGYGMIDASTDCACQSGPATIEPAAPFIVSEAAHELAAFIARRFSHSTPVVERATDTFAIVRNGHAGLSIAVSPDETVITLHSGAIEPVALRVLLGAASVALAQGTATEG